MTRSHFRRLVRWTACLLLLAPAGQAGAQPPRLVVQITVDQLRGDMPRRVLERLEPGGFRYLLEKGIEYRNAHYRHSITFTSAGHAVLFTGASALGHGLAGNNWFDAATGRKVYCVEDARHTLIGVPTKPHQGTSPRNLTTTTIGDELVLASGGRSRVFSVSIKDRGAILPGGHLGKAFWFHAASGRFVTSSYYYEENPGWVTRWNDARPAERYREAGWTLLQPRASYRFGAPDDRAFERPPKGLGNSFPHSFAGLDPVAFHKALTFSPMGDALTVDFVSELIDREQIGQGDATDFLAVSLSVTDYIGHAFGPASLEYEDNLLRLDRTLARLLRHIDESVGLKRTLVVLSSDHGVDEAPEYKAGLGFPAGRHDPAVFLAAANARLREVLGIDADLVKYFLNPSLYLDMAAVERLGLDLPTVERALAEAIQTQDGFMLALARTDLMQSSLPRSPMVERVQNGFHESRSGNVLVVQDPSWYLHPSKTKYAAMHGSPHAYDTHVPILVAGPGIEAREVVRTVAPRDIAPTLALYLDIKSPAGSQGQPLREVLKD